MGVIARLMPALNSRCKSASYAGKIACALVSVEEQLSGEDSRELEIQVSKKASLNVHGMLPSTTLYLALFQFCFYFYSCFFLLSLS